ncbi:SDR family NAD(P)-dependent oxidoreductase [Chloroflexota bacterium]
MDLGLKGKTAVVVGGGGPGMGSAICTTLAAEGADVVIASRTPEKLKKVEGAIKALGSKAVSIKTDATNYDEMEAMVNKTLEKFGKIDILVNVVGLGVGPQFLMSKPEHWDTCINLNMRTMYNACRLVLPHMVERQAGSIVTISSDAGRIGEFRQEVYSGVKAAVTGSTKSMVRNVGRYGIRLNVVCPGMTVRDPEPGVQPVASQVEQQSKIARDLYPLRRLGKPQDIANAVAFLASDRASFITGQTISVSGGYVMM